VSRLNRELRYLQDQHEAQEAWIRKCEEEKPWEHLWGLACRFDMDASKVLGLIHSYEGDIATAARYEKIARDSMEASKAELDASQQKLSENQQQAGEIRKAITATEASIASVSKVLADIREVIQPFRKAIDTFAITLTDAKGVDLAAAQSRTLNYLSFLSSQIDDAAASSARAVSQSNQTLGENWVKACPVQQ
jgi:chromosome segregation ATPase